MSRLFVSDVSILGAHPRDSDDRHEAVWVNWYNEMYFVTLAGHGACTDEHVGFSEVAETRLTLDMFCARPEVYERLDEVATIVKELRETGLL